MRCERCQKETDITTMSYFNTQTICMECEAKEKQHPQFEKARESVNDFYRNGESNFIGIGLPEDLK